MTDLHSPTPMLSHAVSDLFSCSQRSLVLMLWGIWSAADVSSLARQHRGVCPFKVCAEEHQDMRTSEIEKELGGK